MQVSYLQQLTQTRSKLTNLLPFVRFLTKMRVLTLKIQNFFYKQTCFFKVGSIIHCQPGICLDAISRVGDWECLDNNGSCRRQMTGR